MKYVMWSYLLHDLAKHPRGAEGKMRIYKLERVCIDYKISSNNFYIMDDITINLTRIYNAL